MNQKRRPVEDTKAQLIDHGLNELIKGRVKISAGGLSLEKAHKELGIPRSSAYAAWSHETLKPQDAYRRTVLLHARDLSLQRFNDDQLASALQMVVDGAPFEDVVRIVGNQATTWPPPDGWEIEIAAACATVSLTDSERQELTASLREQFEDFSENLYGDLLEHYGFEPRPSYGPDAIISLANGIAMIIEGNYVVGTEDPGLCSATIDRNGDGKLWTIGSICIASVIDEFFHRP